MTHKTHDLVVKTGEYQQNGETKSRYENIGSMMEGDNGPFLIMKRTFNPAGVVNPENKEWTRGVEAPTPEIACAVWGVYPNSVYVFEDGKVVRMPSAVRKRSAYLGGE